MAGRVEGLTAIVSAAGQGIGRAAALALAAEGAQVLATDIDQGRLAGLTGTARIETATLDVLDGAAISALATERGAPDILFNCAGFVHHGSILDCDEEAFDFSFSLNVRAMYRMMRAFLPGMAARGSGAVINMSSVVSSVIGAPNRVVYGATKAAVIGMTKSAAVDFVARGVRVNAICPGTVDTPSLEDRMRAGGDYDTARAAFMARQPTGRFGTAEEVAELVVYLASPAAAFVTGSAIVIDGGWSAA
jgi:2-keto-3-deoxy-L-fuconate dehydrogenase